MSAAVQFASIQALAIDQVDESPTSSAPPIATVEEGR